MIDRAGFPPSNFDHFVSTPLNDPMWSQRGFLSHDTQVDVPSLFVNGWHDYGVGETISKYRFFKSRAQSETARRNQHLLISPATHCADAKASDDASYLVGERPVGDVRFPIRDVYTAWFRRWLAGATEAKYPIAPVTYYLMGKNEWRTARDMPVPRTQFTKYYLSAGPAGASGSVGGGSMSTSLPTAVRSSTTYTYDPANPNLIISGPLCCDLSGRRTGSFDQRQAQRRDDVLVFTTPPLRRGMEVTGPIKLVLYVSSDAPDTDFVGKLMDVYPDGRAFLLNEGILRARYREGFDRAVLMTPGQVYRIEVDLQATGNYFKPGHRARLEIASSHFPRFDRNLNTGGPQVTETKWRVARNTLHHARNLESYLLLPIVPEGAAEKFVAPR
jgi:putative CocE/NonD family hydrolase